MNVAKFENAGWYTVLEKSFTNFSSMGIPLTVPTRRVGCEDSSYNMPDHAYRIEDPSRDEALYHPWRISLCETDGFYYFWSSFRLKTRTKCTLIAWIRAGKWKEVRPPPPDFRKGNIPDSVGLVKICDGLDRYSIGHTTSHVGDLRVHLHIF